MKIFQTLLVKVARTPENKAILEKIRKKELFPANNLHSFTGNKDVYFTSETTRLNLALSTQRMLLRSMDKETQVLSVEGNKERACSETMYLPIIIAKYLISTGLMRELYVKEIEGLTKVPFQAVHVSLTGMTKEKNVFKKAIRKMQIAKKK